MMTHPPARVRAALPVALLALAVPLMAPQPLPAQTFVQGQCTVGVLNQTANVQADGTWDLPNVPANMGPVRARVTCVEDGETLSGASDFFQITANRMNAIPRIELGTGAAIPEEIFLTLPLTTFSSPGETTQATVTARFADGSFDDVSRGEDGTLYVSSNPAVATVGPDGRVTAVASGRALVSALHESILSSVLVTAILSPDSDGDGLPDDLELSLGLDPTDPVDALEDLDGDGLSNRAEFDLGTRLDRADSDGDGLADGEEIAPGRDGFVTHPLLADSDGDGVADGLEVDTGTDPTDAGSVDYAAVLVGLTVEPGAFTLVNNALLPDEVSRRLRVTGLLVDRSEADLTARPEVAYSSSDLAVASFGAEPGRVFAGRDGTARVTAELAGLTATVDVAIVTFSPRVLSFVPIPGFANGVAVADGFAYVAAGATGLHVVDVRDPEAPQLVASLDTAGNANDVRVAEGLVYLTDGERGLVVVDVADPTAPVLLAEADTPGVATDLVVAGGFAYVADGGAGLAVLDVSDPEEPRLVASLDTPGRARGVDVDGGLAVVADELGGVHVFDVADPTAPALVGSTHTRVTTSRAADVVLRGRTAYVADGADSTLGGLKVVDLTDPTTPAVVGGSDDGFGLTGVALDRSLALTSDYFFRNAVPAFDVRQEVPRFSGAVDLSAASRRDDDGSGIAVEGGLFFLAGARGGTDNGTAGDGGLHVARYAIVGDDFGIAPTVELTSPDPASAVRERRPLELRAIASDDVLVESVTFFVDGQSVGSDASPPYELVIPAPEGPARVTVGAIATDLGGRQGVAPDLEVTVLADPSPTVSIVSPTVGSSVVAGAPLEVAVSASDDTALASVDLFVDGAFFARRTSWPFRFGLDVPATAAELTFVAVATDEVGQSTSSEPVSVAIVPDRPPAVEIARPLDGDEVVEGATVAVVAGAVDDVRVDSVRFVVDGEPVAEDREAPFELALTVSPEASEVRVRAEATDSTGQNAASAEITLVVVPDPGTTVVGRVVLEDGTAVTGAVVSALGVSTTSLGDGSFELEGVSTAAGPFQVTAESVDGALQGSSSIVQSVPGGVVDVGALAIAGRRPVLGMVADNGSDSVVVFDAATDTVVGAVPILLGSGTLGDCSVAADQTQGFVTNALSQLWAIDLTAVPPRLPTQDNPVELANLGLDTALSPDERFIVICDGSLRQPVSVVDVASRRLVSAFDLGTDCNSVDVCGDGSVLVTSGNPFLSPEPLVRRLTLDGAGALHDTGERLMLPAVPVNVVCAPDAHSGVVILRSPDHARSFSVPGLLEHDVRSDSGAMGAFHPSGRVLFTRNEAGVTGVEYAPLTGGFGEVLVSFDVESPRPLFGVEQMVIHPDGTKLYVSQPGALDVYDPASGALVRRITHPALVEPTGVCFPRVE